MGNDSFGEAVCCIIALIALAIWFEPSRIYAIMGIFLFVMVIVVILIFKGASGKATKPAPTYKKPKNYGSSTQNRISRVNCSKCGFDNSSEQSYCGKCGQPLSSSTAQPVSSSYTSSTLKAATVQCSRCGHICPAQNHFCGRCGASLEKGDETEIY